MYKPDEPRWFIEVPETSGVCLLGAQCRLWDRWHDPWHLVFEGPLDECQVALEAVEVLGEYP